MRDPEEEELKERRGLLHKLNGQLLEALRTRVERYTRRRGEEFGSWEHWIINVIILDRTIEEKEEAFLKTSATMLRGKVYDTEDKLENTEDIGDFDRIVPLKGSFSGYCIRSGNVVWVDDINRLEREPNHPLYREYRPFEYVTVQPESRPVAEYVFPLRVKIGLSEAILGVVNAECTRNNNQFREIGFHRILDLIIKPLDVHGPFLVLADSVTPKEKEELKLSPPERERQQRLLAEVRQSLLYAHRSALESIALPQQHGASGL